VFFLFMFIRCLICLINVNLVMILLVTLVELIVYLFVEICFLSFLNESVVMLCWIVFCIGGETWCW